MIKYLFNAVIIIFLGVAILVAVSYCGNHPTPQNYKTQSPKIKINIPPQTDWRHVDAEVIESTSGSRSIC